MYKTHWLLMTYLIDSCIKLHHRVITPRRFWGVHFFVAVHSYWTKAFYWTRWKRWDELWWCICYVGIAVNNVGQVLTSLTAISTAAEGDTARSNAKPMPPYPSGWWRRSRLCPMPCPDALRKLLYTATTPPTAWFRAIIPKTVTFRYSTRHRLLL